MQDACDLAVRLTPRADRDAIVGMEDGVVAVRVSAPPVDGQANVALIKVLAKALGVPKTRLSIVRGQAARDKLVRVEGLSAADAHARLNSSSQASQATGVSRTAPGASASSSRSAIS